VGGVIRGGGAAADGGEAEVADLDLALAAVDEDVVALEVAVDDAAGVEVGEAVAAKDLPPHIFSMIYVGN